MACGLPGALSFLASPYRATMRRVLLSMPMQPRFRRSLAPTGFFASADLISTAAISSLAYQTGRPAAVSPASDRCKKPRRDRFPRFSMVSFPWAGEREYSDQISPSWGATPGLTGLVHDRVAAGR